MFCLQFIWIFLFVLLSVLETWTKLYMFIWSQQRHNFRLFKICRWASLECWQCVQTRQGVWWQGKSQSFLVMASPTDQMEKKETEGWKKRGQWVPPYFMPAQIWPRLGNFLVAKPFWEHALLFGLRATCIQRGIPLLLLQEAKTHRGLLGRLWAALLILESQCKR